MPTAELNGVSLHYRTTGEGAPAFLLFNGAGLRLGVWGEVADRLTELGSVIRFDQRGVGGTRAEGPFSLQTVATDARGLLDFLHVSRAIAVGHAWGGRVAQVFARDYPDRVVALVVCGTGGQLPATFSPEWRDRLRKAASSGDRATFDEAIVALYCAKNFAARAPEAATSLFDEMWESRFDGRGAVEASAATPSPSYWGLAACPVQLIYGRQDKFGTPENGLDLHGRLANSRLAFIEDAGHLAIREQPDLVFQAIAAFVRQRGESR